MVIAIQAGSPADPSLAEYVAACPQTGGLPSSARVEEDAFGAMFDPHGTVDAMRLGWL